MIRLFLALIISLMSVIPAQAFCSVDSGPAPSCCCVSAPAPADCAEVSGTCCEMTTSEPVAPTSETSQSALRTPAAVSTIIPQMHDSVHPAPSVARLDLDRRPLHLASNKVYLLYRSFLI
ncbi:MAG: hypothetical protein K2X93_24625 [Candidatus Obscuribacterales bacterium]|nr:hypothetical protein [Candidatus Obscuribacterales bacterium]